MRTDEEVIGFPKPQSRKLERQAIKRLERKWISEIRTTVMARDGHRCRACGNRLPKMDMHEIIYRSRTRGRPIEDRVNTKLCVLLCHQCHMNIHNHQLEVEVVDEAFGADGQLVFTKKDSS